MDLTGTALVLVDLQHACVDRSRTRVVEVVVPNAVRLLDWFRGASLHVIYTRVGSRLPAGEDLHAKRRIAWHRRVDGPLDPVPLGSPQYEIIPELRPRSGELTIDKTSAGAFNSSALDLYLHQWDIHGLIVCGVATSACVYNTARDAADRGYNTMLVEDACDGGTHDSTMRTFGRYFGAVKGTEVLLKELSESAHNLDLFESPLP